MLENSAFFIPVQTADIAFDDIPSAKKKGLEQALYVFIDGNDLIVRWQSLLSEHSLHFVIAETEFGYGLNFLLTWSLWNQFAPPSARLHFISCAKHPVSRDDLLNVLTFFPELQEQANCLLANYPLLTPGFHHLQFEGGRVNLTLMFGDVLSCYSEMLLCGDVIVEKKLRESCVDAWFFTDVNHSLMWNQELLMTMGMLSKPLTTLATLTTVADMKDGLESVGFKVQKIQSNDRQLDRLVAEFDCISSGHSKRYTPWHTPSPKGLGTRRALVLGAGLAGCYTANALARRGWNVTLIDEESSVGCGASGNQQAILFPQLSAFSSPLARLMLSSYLFSLDAYKKILKKSSIGELSGLLQLAFSQKERVAQAKLQPWLAHYCELGRLVNAEEASDISGVSLQSGGLFIPQSGWFDSPALCQYLIQQHGISYELNTFVHTVEYDGKEWHASEYHADILVIANGYRANQFIQTEHLPLKAVRGQMTSIVSNAHSARLRVVLCADGHIIPARAGLHSLGATYYSGLADNASSMLDDMQNLAKLDSLSKEVEWSLEVAGHWAGVRAATPDYLPMVGPVADADGFRQQFATLATDSNRWIGWPGVYHEGLYSCTGFGSRGLTTIPFCAEWLAATINKEPSFMPRTMVQSLSPARFLRKDIIKGNADVKFDGEAI
jgi:tRNA 5-methylaminomethyl-2-thiouridine biosynthesis bifunctional protein